MKYPRLFEPGQIGKLKLKNRIAVTPVGLPYACSNGEVSEDLMVYLEERAKAGAGLVMPGIVLVDPETGKVKANELVLCNEGQMTSFARLARRIHKYDAKIFLQLYHPGKETTVANLGGKAPVCPSQMKTRSGEMTRALSTEEVEAMVQKFVKSAVLAQKAGIDGVEVHAAHGYLINQFMTPLFNKRTDKYGGSFENRMRFPSEIISGIRAACGPDYVISVRISADEFIEGGNTLEDAVKFSQLFESLGANLLNVNCSLQETSKFNREPPSFQQGWKKYLAATIKKNVNIPVLAVNTIKKPDFAESLLEEGVCDFVGLSRQHLAEPQWAKKVATGREDELRTCISCLHCMAEFIAGRIPTCSVNPRLGREREFSEIKKDGAGRTVVVIGGGPGGLEAARVLAERGFRVTLFEKSAELGGQLNYANKPHLKEKITWLKQGMEAQVRKAGVDIRLNTEATVENVQALQPVGVFLCVGSVPLRPAAIRGIDGTNVCTVPEVLSGQKNLDGKTVVIVGTGLAGLETGVFLGDRGCKLSFIEMQETVGPGIFGQVLEDVQNELKPFNPSFYPGHTLVAIDANGVEAQNKEGQTVHFPADAVVLAMGVKPRQDMIETFQNSFERVVLVGDAIKDGRIVDATSTGFIKAWVFDPE